jgi:PAS domain S-box-containing protein
MVWWLWAQSMYPLCDMQGWADKKQSTEDASQLTTLASYGAQACCIWNEEDGFHHFSDNWARVTGLPPADCMGAAWLDYFHPDAMRDFAAGIGDLFTSDPYDQTDSEVMEVQIMRGDSSWGWLDITMVAMSSVGGHNHVSILVTDVTELKQLASEARQAQRESQLAQHGREAFLSNMSHELRTPLNAVLGFAQMLESGFTITQDNAMEYLRHIRESGEQLLTKINDLMEIANIEAHRARMAEEPLNLREIIEGAVEIHSHEAFTRDIRVRYDLDRPNIVLQADRAKLTHALGNIIASAIESSPKESEIIVAVHAAVREGLTITVTNRGAGQPKDHLDNIRQELSQHQSDFSTDIGTIGIGLSIAKELVELHHGSMHVEHITGFGSITSVHLPPGRIISLSARVKHKHRFRTMA